jgi:hypothetical protein
VPNRQRLIAINSAMAGFSLVLLGEGFCEGVIGLGGSLTPAQLFDSAEVRFTRAITAATAAGDANVLNLAYVGRARARLNKGQKPGAAEDAARVPVGFVYNATADATIGRRNNRIFQQVNQSNATSVAPIAATVGQWFDRKRGLALNLALSGATLAVATPVFVRARTTAAFQALRRGEAGTPSPDREFRPTDLIVVRTAIADNDATPAAVTAEVLTREGKALATLLATLTGGQFQVDLPLRSLALGQYVLRFTATRGETSATSTAGFAIIR